MTNEDLDLVPTEELFSALGRRFRYVVLLAEKDYGNDGAEMEAYYDGGFTGAWGLVARAPTFFDKLRSSKNKGSHPE